MRFDCLWDRGREHGREILTGVNGRSVRSAMAPWRKKSYYKSAVQTPDGGCGLLPCIPFQTNRLLSHWTERFHRLGGFINVSLSILTFFLEYGGIEFDTGFL